MEAARELAQLLERERKLLPAPPRIVDAASGSPRSLDSASRRASESETRRCWAPSWRFRSSRRRSASAASTRRERDRRSSSSSRFRAVMSIAQMRKCSLR